MKKDKPNMLRPAEPAMLREIEKHASAVRRRYVGTARYALEVDARGHARQLVNDMRRGTAGE